MKVLLTGGAGYIGSHIGMMLLSEGYRIVTVDNLSKGHRQAVPGGTFYQTSLADRNGLAKIFATEQVDAVIHLAASSQVGESMMKPEAYFRNNLINGLNLVEVMLEADVKTLVFSSSAAVYGEPEVCPILEMQSTIPSNPYGLSKLYFEGILDWFNRSHQFNYVALRYFNAAGADPQGRFGEDHRPETHLIPLLLQVALGERPSIEIYGSEFATPDGTCIRDYVHVNDISQAHILALRYLASGGSSRSYNLGSQTGFSNLEVLRAAETVVGMKIPYRFGPRREGDPARLVASAELARTELSWEPKSLSLEKIIADAWEWHRRHPRGYTN